MFLDADEGERQKAQGISKAARGIDPEWAETVGVVIAMVADRGEPFTTDQVWEALDVLSIAYPDESRAMGVVMRQAASDGVIVPTNDYRLSERPVCHRRPMRVWKPA